MGEDSNMIIFSIYVDTRAFNNEWVIKLRIYSS